MTKPIKNRTQRDLFLHLIEEIGDQMGGTMSGPLLRERFERELLPTLVLRADAEKQLSDEEYERQFSELKNEIPAFLNFLLNSEPPPFSGH